MGCGFGFKSVELLTSVVQQIPKKSSCMFSLRLMEISFHRQRLYHKQLLTSSGVRSMTPGDAKTVAALKGALYTCREISDRMCEILESGVKAVSNQRPILHDRSATDLQDGRKLRKTQL